MKAVRAKPIAIRAWKRLLREHPDWKVYLGNCEGSQLEVAVPSTPGVEGRASGRLHQCWRSLGAL